ncbi:MAG: methyltransferase domain-containing protein [Burkholderiales bacterium]|nr:methyltransferase domain-containing protein [Burkholderiales bacterium]
MNFNEKAHIWDLISLSQQQAADDLFTLLDIKELDNVLDMGCGTGYLTEKIYNITPNVIGIDKAQNMIKVAQEKRPFIRFNLGDAEQLEIHNCYDWIVTNAVTYYFKDMPGTFSRFYNALKINGSYALQSQVLRTPQFIQAFKKLEEDPITQDIYATFKLPTQILDLSQLVTILKSVKFTIKYAKVINYATKYSVAQALDIFKSGAATQYLNADAYRLPLTDTYIMQFWYLIENSLKEQAINDKITLEFPRCFIVAQKC